MGKMAKRGPKSKYNPDLDYEKLTDDYLATVGREQTKLPKTSEFCREYIGANEDTVELWIKGENLPKGADTTELIGAIKRIKEAQKHQLMDDGLYGGKEVNSTMAIFLLKANHEMVETDRHEHTGKDGTPLGVVVLPEVNGKHNMATPSRATDGSPKEG